MLTSGSILNFVTTQNRVAGAIVGVTHGGRRPIHSLTHWKRGEQEGKG